MNEDQDNQNWGGAVTSEALKVISRLEESTKAAFALARQLVAARGDADEWTRLPASRCPISNWSRSKINRLIMGGQIRGKTVGASRFYSAADVRKLLNA